MSVQVIATNVADVMDAIEALLLDAAPLIELNATVEQAENPEQRSDACPWIGIYRTGVVFEQRSMGMGAGFRMQHIAVLLLCQESSVTSGKDCARSLEGLIQRTINALLSDTSLRATVDTIQDFSTVYDRYDKRGSAYVQSAQIFFTALRPVGVTIV